MTFSVPSGADRFRCATAPTQVSLGRGHSGEQFGDGRFHAVQRVGERGASAVSAHQRHGGHRCRHARGEVADHHHDRRAHFGAHGHHGAGHLAQEARLVEQAFAGDDEIGRGEALAQAEFVGDQFAAGPDAGAECGQAAGQPTGCAAPGTGGDIDPELVAVFAGERLEPRGECGDLAGVGALLGREQPGRVDERGRDVDGDHDLVAARPVEGRALAQHVDRTSAAVGGGRTAGPDDDQAGPGVDGRGDELAGAPGVRGQRIVLAVDQRPPRGRGHLDDGPRPVEAPAGADPRAERAGDLGVAVRAAEAVEQALAAVGHRPGLGGPARGGRGAGDGRGDVGRTRGAAELVGHGQQARCGVHLREPSGRPSNRPGPAR